eukprot:Gb_14807 [translate_table: standard]
MLLVLRDRVGNVVTYDYYDSLGTVRYWWAHSMISDETYRAILDNCNFTQEDDLPSCDHYVNYAMNNEFGNIDQYSIYTPSCTQSGGNRTFSDVHYMDFHMLRLIAGYDPCTANYADKYYNQPDAQEALHANTTKIPYGWTGCRMIQSSLCYPYTKNSWQLGLQEFRQLMALTHPIFPNASMDFEQSTARWLVGCSQVCFPGEKIMEEAKTFTTNHLQNALARNNAFDKWDVKKDLPGEVEYALKYPWHRSMPRFEARSYIEQFGSNDVWLGKTVYKMLYVSNEKYLELAKFDFNMVQALHQKETQHIVRIVYAKTSCLAVILDDLYDTQGSLDDLKLFCEVGTENIRGMSLVRGGSVIWNEDEFGNPCPWPTDSFANLTGLQLLVLKDANCLEGDFSKLSKGILWLSSSSCSYERMPPNFQMNQTSLLDLSGRNIESLWTNSNPSYMPFKSFKFLLQMPMNLYVTNYEECRYRIQRSVEPVLSLRLQMIDLSGLRLLERKLFVYKPTEDIRLQVLTLLDLNLERLLCCFAELTKVENLNSEFRK